MMGKVALRPIRACFVSLMHTDYILTTKSITFFERIDLSIAICRTVTGQPRITELESALITINSGGFNSSNHTVRPNTTQTTLNDKK